MMDRNTGHTLGELAHLRQSIADILATPIGTRVMRRDYGSLVPQLLDQPDTDTTQLRVFSAVASALMRWEPRLLLTKLSIERDPTRPGHAVVTLAGAYLSPAAPRPQPLQLTVPISGTAL